MGRLAAILLAVTGTVALQVIAQAVVLTSVRFIGHRMRGASELRRTFWISLGAVLPLFFGHFAQVGLWRGSSPCSAHSTHGCTTTGDAERRITGRALRRRGRRAAPSLE